MKTRHINKTDLIKIIDYLIDSYVYDYDHLIGIYQLEMEAFGPGWSDGLKQALQRGVRDLSILKRIIKESML